MNKITIGTNCLLMIVCTLLLSCKPACKRTELRCHENMSYQIEYLSDTIVITVKEQGKETQYTAEKRNGEYYGEDGLFLSTLRDTVIQNGNGLPLTTTHIRKITEHDPLASLMEKYGKDLYMTDTRFVNESSPKDGAWSLSTYIYDKDYHIVQVNRFLYATFE